MMDERLTDEELLNANNRIMQRLAWLRAGDGIDLDAFSDDICDVLAAAHLARAAVPADPPRVTVLLPDGDAREVGVAFVDWAAPGELQVCITVRDRVAVAQPQEPVAWMAEDNTGYRGLTFIAPQTAEGAWDGFTITPLYAAPLARQEPTGWEKCAEPGSWHCGSGVMGMTKDYAYRKFDSGWHRLALPPAVAASGVTLKIALPPPANRSGAKTVEAPLGGPEVMEPFWCHEQSHDRARCEAECAECAEDDVPVSQESNVVETLRLASLALRNATAPVGNHSARTLIGGALLALDRAIADGVALPRVRDADEPLPPDVLVDAHTDRAHQPEQLKPCTRGVAPVEAPSNVAEALPRKPQKYNFYGSPDNGTGHHAWAESDGEWVQWRDVAHLFCVKGPDHG